MSKTRIRRIRDPWWHWPVAVLWVLFQVAVVIGVLLWLAMLIGPRLNQWVDTHPEAYLLLLFGGAGAGALCWVFAMARSCVEQWRRR